MDKTQYLADPAVTVRIARAVMTAVPGLPGINWTFPMVVTDEMKLFHLPRSIEWNVDGDKTPFAVTPFEHLNDTDENVMVDMLVKNIRSRR